MIYVKYGLIKLPKCFTRGLVGLIRGYKFFLRFQVIFGTYLTESHDIDHGTEWVPRVDLLVTFLVQNRAYLSSTPPSGSVWVTLVPSQHCMIIARMSQRLNLLQKSSFKQ